MLITGCRLLLPLLLFDLLHDGPAPFALRRPVIVEVPLIFKAAILVRMVRHQRTYLLWCAQKWVVRVESGGVDGMVSADDRCWFLI